MTGPSHYTEAELLLVRAEIEPETSILTPYFMAAAQVHATLALAAATAEPIAQAYDGREDVRIPRAWSAAIS